MSVWREIQEIFDEYLCVDFIAADKSDDLIIKEFISGKVKAEYLIPAFFRANSLLKSTVIEFDKVVEERSGKRRSIGDIYSIIKNYYKDIELEDVFNLLKKEVLDNKMLTTFVCPDIDKRVYRMEGHSYVIEDKFYDLIDKSREESSESKQTKIGDVYIMDELGMYFSSDENEVPQKLSKANYLGYESKKAHHPDDPFNKTKCKCNGCGRMVTSFHPDQLFRIGSRKVKTYMSVAFLHSTRNSGSFLANEVDFASFNNHLKLHNKCIYCFVIDGESLSDLDSSKAKEIISNEFPKTYDNALFHERFKKVIEAYPDGIVINNGKVVQPEVDMHIKIQHLQETIMYGAQRSLIFDKRRYPKESKMLYKNITAKMIEDAFNEAIVIHGGFQDQDQNQIADENPNPANEVFGRPIERHGNGLREQIRFQERVAAMPDMGYRGLAGLQGEDAERMHRWQAADVQRAADRARNPMRGFDPHRG